MRSWLFGSKEESPPEYSGYQTKDFFSAARGGKLEEVEGFLANKAVFRDYQSEKGDTALMWAAWSGHTAVVSRLVQAGVDKHLQNKVGETALIRAVSHGHLEVVTILLKAKVDKEQQDNDGRRALHWAAWYGHTAIADALLFAGAQKDCQDKDGNTPLMQAAKMGQAVVLNRLLQSGVEVDKARMDGTTALMWAANCGKADVVSSLLQAGANVNKQTLDGNTALMGAVHNCHAAIAERLLQAGADRSIKAKDGKTAVDMARTAVMQAVFIPRTIPATTQVSAAVPAVKGTADSRPLPPPAVKATADSRPLPHPAVKATADSRPLPPPVVKATADSRPLPPPAVKATADSRPLPPPAVTATADTRPLPPPAVKATALSAPAPTAVGAPAVAKAVSAPIPTTSQSNPVAVAVAPAVPTPPKPATATPNPAQVPALAVVAPTPTTKPAQTQPTTVSTPAPAPVAPVVAKASPKSVPVPPPAPTSAPVKIALSVATAAPAGTVRPTPAASAPAAAQGAPFVSASSTSNTTGSAVPVLATAGAEFTEQDRAALQTLSQASTQSLLVHGRLSEMILTVAAHDRTLQLLVSKQKECPSLFWFYPKKRELRNWLSNPGKCLFQDTLMMVVVCPVTLCVVQCGPQGVGWEIAMPKEWVKKWGPAILFSIYVMQAAVVAGRVVGIPLPQLPSASNLTGLSSTVLGVAVNNVVNQENMMKCLTEFASTTATVLGQQNKEMQALCDNIQQQGRLGVAPVGEKKALAEYHVKQMTGDAYKSLHTFLTTGDNAKLGKLEDQLRGRMERVMAPNGDVDWVSVEGREMWLEQRKWLAVPLVSAPPPPKPSSVVPPVIATSTASTALPETWNATPSGSKKEITAPSPTQCSSWLAVRLRSLGIDEGHIHDCELKLVKGEGFASEVRFAGMPTAEFDTAYLKRIGIAARGLQMELIALHSELRTQHHPSSAVPAVTSAGMAHPLDGAATFTSEEKSAVLQMQNTIQDLTSQLSKLRASASISSAATASGAGNRSTASRGGGLALQQAHATANAINPRTKLPYTMDDLSEEILRLQREVAQTNRDIGNVAATTQEKFENLQPRTAQPTGPAVTKKKGMFW